MSMSKICSDLNMEASTASNNLRVMLAEEKVSKFKNGMLTIFVLSEPKNT